MTGSILSEGLPERVSPAMKSSNGKDICERDMHVDM